MLAFACAFPSSTKVFFIASFVAGGSRGLTTNTYSSKIPSPIPFSTLCFATGTIPAAPRPPAALLHWKGRSQPTHAPTLSSNLSHSQQQSPLPFLLSLSDCSVNWWCSRNSSEIFSYFSKEKSSAILVNKSAMRRGPKSAGACTR